MKTMNVRLPERLVASIEAESRDRKMSKSDVIRERLERGVPAERKAGHLDGIADLIGSVKGLPRDLSANVDKYLSLTGYGRNRRR